jgi:hypothetical protein
MGSGDLRMNLRWKKERNNGDLEVDDFSIEARNRREKGTVAETPTERDGVV